jgi:hypothetical protein
MDRLDANAVTPYLACLQSEAARVPGIHVGVRAADSTGILLLVGWTVPSAGPVQVTWTSPVIQGQALERNFPPGEKTIRVPRPPTDVKLAANVPGYTSEAVTLAPLPGPPPPLPPLTTQDVSRKLIGEYVVHLGQHGGCNGGAPNSVPARLATIGGDGIYLIATNECGTRTSLTIDPNLKTVYYFGDSGTLA